MSKKEVFVGREKLTEILKNALDSRKDSDTITGLARRIKQKHNINKSVRQIRFYLGQILKGRTISKVKVVDSKKVTKEPYIVIGSQYHIQTPYETLLFDVATIDQLFYKYSRYGMNMTSTAIRNEYNLKPHAWIAIKRELQLYKDSNVFSPYTWDNTPAPKREKMVADKMAEYTDNLQHVIEKQYDEQIRKKYKATIEGAHGMGVWADRMAEAINCDKVVIKIRELSASEKLVIPKLFVSVADFHAGASTKGLSKTREFNYDKLKEILDEVAAGVNAMRAKEVSIGVLGDLIASWMGMNHPNSWQGLGYDGYGHKLVIKTLDLIGNFIGSVHNVKNIRAVPGNHDRGTNSNKDDVKGEIGLLIYELLARTFGEIDVKTFPVMGGVKYDDMVYIMSHGHLPASSKPAGHIVSLHGDPSLFNIILQGHGHARKTGDDVSYARKITVPPIFSGDYYSESLGLVNNPGFIMSYNGGKGYPVIIDHTL